MSTAQRFIPDLLTLTENDPEWTWGLCVSCASPHVEHRGLYIRPSLSETTDEWEVNRVAWCGAEICQEDRTASADSTIYPKLGSSEDAAEEAGR